MTASPAPSAVRWYGSLCTYDPRNPWYSDSAESLRLIGESVPEPRVSCACDNCFYGRDALAVALIDALAAHEAREARVAALEAALTALKRNCYTHNQGDDSCECAFIDAALAAQGGGA